MKKKVHYFKIFLVSAILIASFASTYISNVHSDTRVMRKIYIYIDKVRITDCLDAPWGKLTWYELQIFPEYMRLFGERGRKLQSSDYQYDDWSSIGYVYPPGIEANADDRNYETDLRIEWSYCLGFENNLGGRPEDDLNYELYIKFRLIRHNPHKSMERGVHFGAGAYSQYNTYYWTPLLDYYKFGGKLQVRLKIVLL